MLQFIKSLLFLSSIIVALRERDLIFPESESVKFTENSAYTLIYSEYY